MYQNERMAHFKFELNEANQLWETVISDNGKKATLIKQSIDIDPGLVTLGVGVTTTVVLPSKRFADKVEVVFYPNLIDTFMFENDLQHTSLFEHGKKMIKKLDEILAPLRKAPQPISVRIEDQFDVSRGVGYGNPIYTIALMIGGFFESFFDPSVRENKTVSFVSAETKILDAYLERKLPRELRKELSWKITKTILDYYREFGSLIMNEGMLNTGAHDGCDCYVQSIAHVFREYAIERESLSVLDIVKLIQANVAPYNEMTEWDVKKRKMRIGRSNNAISKQRKVE